MQVLYLDHHDHQRTMALIRLQAVFFDDDFLRRDRNKMREDEFGGHTTDS